MNHTINTNNLYNAKTIPRNVYKWCQRKYLCIGDFVLLFFCSFSYAINVFLKLLNTLLSITENAKQPTSISWNVLVFAVIWLKLIAHKYVERKISCCCHHWVLRKQLDVYSCHDGWTHCSIDVMRYVRTQWNQYENHKE